MILDGPSFFNRPDVQPTMVDMIPHRAALVDMNDGTPDELLMSLFENRNWVNDDLATFDGFFVRVDDEFMKRMYRQAELKGETNWFDDPEKVAKIFNATCIVASKGMKDGDF